MKILYKFATRSRPEKFFNALDNIIEMSACDNWCMMVSIDDDDESMSKKRILHKALSYNLSNVCLYYGESKNKIDAINRDMNAHNEWATENQDWKILINMSDDMKFLKKGFDDEIRNSFNNNLDQFIHFNDGNQKDNVSTMSIMGRDYYERDKHIYFAGYKSVWCDVEATEVAFMRGKYKYMGDGNIIFNHNHPAWGKANYDEQYRSSENLDVWGEDLKTLIKRKMNNYYLSPSEVINSYKYHPIEVEKWKTELNNARANNNLQPIKF